MTALRQLRGALSIALIWATAWSVAGMSLGAWRILFGSPHFANQSQYLGQYVRLGGLLFGVCGLLAGLGFAWLLSRAGKHRTLPTLSGGRVAIWGFGGGGVAGLLAVPLFGVASVPFVVVGASLVGVLGSLFAFGTIRLAQIPLEELAATPSMRNAVTG